MRDPISLSLQALYQGAPIIKISNRDRLVIFSDLHVGNRGPGDDFLKNASLFMDVLRTHYLPEGYTLVLNGDVEEMHRFSLKEIEGSWPELYDLFGEYDSRGRLHKIVGNHDIALPLYREYPYHSELLEALKIEYKDDVLFVFHGHQASSFQTRFNVLIGLTLRYVARPLRIRNYSVSSSKLRQYRMERRVYAFSHSARIAAVVGHTHRPLFESLSKVDALRFTIERLCREYTTARPRERSKLAADIQRRKEELDRVYDQKGEQGGRQNRLSIYNTRLLIPCLFNSGCCIGKRGITAVEIRDGQIALVHWFDKERGGKHFDFDGQQPQHLDGSNCFRVVLKQETLDYIFTRIRMLSD